MDPAEAAALKERVLAERQRRADEAAAEEERLRLEAEEKLRLKHLRFNQLDEKTTLKEQAEADTMLALARARASKAEVLLADADAAHMSLMPGEGEALEAESKRVRVLAIETFVAVILIAQESGDQRLEAEAYQHMALLRLEMAHWAERATETWASADGGTGKPQGGQERKEMRRLEVALLERIKGEMALQLVAARAAFAAARGCYAAAQIVPGEAAAALSLGGICMRLGDETAALEALESALELFQGPHGNGVGGGPDEHAVDTTLNTLRLIMVRQGTFALYGKGTWIEQEGEEEQEEDGEGGQSEEGKRKVPQVRGDGEVAETARGAAVGSSEEVEAAEAELARQPSNGAVASSVQKQEAAERAGTSGEGSMALSPEEIAERRSKAKEANTLYVWAHFFPFAASSSSSMLLTTTLNSQPRAIPPHSTRHVLRQVRARQHASIGRHELRLRAGGGACEALLRGCARALRGGGEQAGGGQLPAADRFVLAAAVAGARLRGAGL